MMTEDSSVITAEGLPKRSPCAPTLYPFGERKTEGVTSIVSVTVFGGGEGVDVGLILPHPQENTHARTLQPTILTTLSPACRAAQAA